MLSVAATVHGTDTRPVFTVDPATDSHVPTIEVETPAGLNWTAFFSEVTDGKAGELVTSVTKTATTEPLHFRFPEVKRDTYIEAALSTSTDRATTPTFTWAGVARAEGGKLIDYAGTKDLLPPKDFDDYWKRAVGELDKVTSNPRVTREADRDSTTGLLYRVELDSVQNTTIVGWLFVPRDAYVAQNPDAEVVKQYPAVILAPGYSGNMRPVDRTRHGYITFSVNPRNHGPSRSYWKSPVEHQMYNITEPDSYYYKLAALDCLQAARFVLGRGEVDSERVGVEGSSQGGYLAVAMAALEPRINCVVANVIAFTAYTQGMALARQGHHVRLRDLLASDDTSKTLVRQSVAYTDGANLMTRVKAPVQINMGGVDPVCPYVCGVVAYNRLPDGVEKSFYVDSGAAHEVSPAMRRRTREWQDRWLKLTEDAEKKD